MSAVNQGLPPLNMPLITPPLTTITSPWYLFLVNLWNRTGGGTGGGTFQTGDYKLSAYGNTPNGWLLCDGSAVSRVTYSGLFTIIGITYGRGDGSTTFNVPNVQDRLFVGASDTVPVGGTVVVGGTGRTALGVSVFIKT